MAKSRDKKLDPLRPRFPRAAILEVTQMNGAVSMAQLSKNCMRNEIDSTLVKAAAVVALGHFGSVRPHDMPATYPAEVAAAVAALHLDQATPTKSESVMAALFEQTIARNPNAASTMRGELLGNLQRDKILTLERQQAVEAAFDLADQVARFSRVPRLYAGNPDLPGQVFQDAQEMALAMPNPRVAVIKTVEAMNRLRTWERVNDRDTKEGQAILTIAEKLYQPLATAVGWIAAANTIQDYVFKYRQPEVRKGVIRAVEDQMGEGFYEREREIVGAGERFIQTLIETQFNRGPSIGEWREVQVHGRAKTAASVHKKLGAKGYGLDRMTDLLAFRIVIPGDDKADCYKALGGLERAFRLQGEDFKDYISDPSKPYDSIHIVATPLERPKGNLGTQLPGELLGKQIEIQIRTHTMDHDAEVGIANHYGYKSVGAVVAGNRYFRSATNYLLTNGGADGKEQPLEIYGRMAPIAYGQAGSHSEAQTMMPEFMIVVPKSDPARQAQISTALQMLFSLQANEAQTSGDANTVIGKLLEAPQMPLALIPPEELKRGQVKIRVISETLSPADCATQGWSAQNETPVSPYLRRVEQVRGTLARLNAGKMPGREAVAESIFIVSEAGAPIRLPNGSGLMDALFALDPKNVRAQQVSHNGVTVDMSSPAAKKVRIKNGDMLMAEGAVDQERRPDPEWLKKGVMAVDSAKSAVAAALAEPGPSGAKVRRPSTPAGTPLVQG